MHEPQHWSLGLRWPIERTISWLSIFGQLRRNTDRFVVLAAWAGGGLLIAIARFSWIPRAR